MNSRIPGLLLGLVLISGCFGPRMSTAEFRRQLALERARCEERMAARPRPPDPVALPVPPAAPPSIGHSSTELVQVAAERDALRVKLEAVELRLAEALARLEKR